MGRSRKSTEYCPVGDLPWLQRSGAMLLKLTFGKTALMIENEMFRGLRTEVTI